MVAAKFALVFGLILLNGVFAMSELAILSARRSRLQRRAAAGSAGARIALELADDPTRLLSTVQIGITLIGILAGALGGTAIAATLADYLVELDVAQAVAEPLALFSIVVVLTYLSLVVGELAPKRFALANADAIASRVAPAIMIIARLAYPAVRLLELSTEGLLRLLRIPSHGRARVTDDEISALVAEGAQQGLIQPAEQEMFEEVLRLADRPVHTIMTHRRDLVWLDLADSAAELRAKIGDSEHSRFPVGDGDLRHCLGYVRTRDIVDKLLVGKPLYLKELLRKPLTVPRELSTLELMSMFRRARPHLAVVTDEYGTALGIVTPTDILETIAGSLARETLVNAQVFRRQDGSWLVDAQMEVQALERVLGAGGLAARPEFITLAGLILEHLGHIPQVGDVLIVNRWRLEIVDRDGHRIDKVMISALPPEGGTTQIRDT